MASQVKPVSVVNHVEDNIGLSCKSDDLLPVLQYTPLKPNYLSVSDVVELSVSDAAVDLGQSNVFRSVQNLSIEVMVVDLVIVHDDDLFYSQSEQVDNDKGAQSSYSKAQGCMGGESLLAPVLDSDLPVEDCAKELFLEYIILLHYNM